jgi:hypothetical protein
MSICSACGTEIALGSEMIIQVKNRRETLCQSCAVKVENEFQAETEGANIPGALFIGVVAALLAGAAWFGIVVATKYEVGFLAMGLGWVVGMAVMFGSGKKRGAPLQIIGAVITLVTMIGSEYFILRYLILQELIKEGYDVAQAPLFLGISETIDLMVEYIKAEPTTLLFWVIAVWEAFVIPARRKLSRAK